METSKNTYLQDTVNTGLNMPFFEDLGEYEAADKQSKKKKKVDY